MRRIHFFILCLFFALQGYCDRVRSARLYYSQKINKSFQGEAKVKMDNGVLVLYKGNQSMKLYLEQWCNVSVYQGKKIIELSELNLRVNQYYYIKQKNKEYILETDKEKIKLKSSKRAKRYFNKHVPCYHNSGHYSHISCYR